MPSLKCQSEVKYNAFPTIFAVETDYGGADALKTFIKEAHKMGIAVIFDVVYKPLGPSDL
jgi:1,4-alpha-glucan branching enzyme